MDSPQEKPSTLWNFITVFASISMLRQTSSSDSHSRISLLCGHDSNRYHGFGYLHRCVQVTWWWSVLQGSMVPLGWQPAPVQEHLNSVSEILRCGSSNTYLGTSQRNNDGKIKTATIDESAAHRNNSYCNEAPSLQTNGIADALSRNNFSLAPQADRTSTHPWVSG